VRPLSRAVLPPWPLRRLAAPSLECAIRPCPERLSRCRNRGIGIRNADWLSSMLCRDNSPAEMNIDTSGRTVRTRGCAGRKEQEHGPRPEKPCRCLRVRFVASGTSGPVESSIAPHAGRRLHPSRSSPPAWLFCVDFRFMTPAGQSITFIRTGPMRPEEMRPDGFSVGPGRNDRGSRKAMQLKSVLVTAISNEFSPGWTSSVMSVW